MNLKYRNRIVPAVILALASMAVLVLNGCSGRDVNELELATAPADPVVFADAFLGGLDYSAFEFSYYEAMTIDQADVYAGTHSLKISIPAGLWAGGSFWTHGPRDLSSFNALTFYAKAGSDLTLDTAGFGIGIVTPPVNQAETTNIQLGTDWRQIIIPIPDPSVLTNERGLFWFSDGGGGSQPVEIIFDEVKFARVDGITNVRPTMASRTIEALQGETVPLPVGVTTFNVNGEDVSVQHTAAYFTFFSSDEEVIVGGVGSATAVGGGTAEVTARLGDVDVVGTVTVTVIGPPAETAPVPAFAAADVISIYSDVYDDIEVDSWRTQWSTSGGVYDQMIAGDNVKAFLGLTNNAYVGIEFIEDQIDAATPGMTHFSLDVYAPQGSVFAVKLVDFGPDGAFGGGDDTERGLNFSSFSTPEFVAGEWVTLDIPLVNFTGMNFGNVAQLILQSPNVGNVWVDNIYFHK
ncbi:MAG: hypothetical protein ABIK96_16965 [bacterium]